MAAMFADKSQVVEASTRTDRSSSREAAAMSGANASSPAAATASTPRSRLPRWTRHETLVLLQAKRAMEQRGRRSPQPLRLNWAVVSAYCRRHGVERGPMQCRKRWGNLSWDLKKIVAWEKNLATTAADAVVPGAGGGGAPDAEAPPPTALESFWDMRGEQRRARLLPSSFDREVYNALVGGVDAAAPPSYFGEDLADADDVDADEPPPPPPLMVMPISARKYEPPATSSQRECSDAATASAKKVGEASDKNSTSQHDGGCGGGGLKDSEATYGGGGGAEEGTTTATATAATASIGRQVIEALERGNRMLGDQLEAQRAMWDMERDQRAALLAAVNKLASAVCRIADKL
ncbi:trihelix transcription factor ASR3-like [Oryza brachyantha]|uniref:trihelix transcription factor ASR3-like n=1 Tax=Oryza brachyantha TaxID=4533 RepID=UPI001ADD212B|nr:trihelix transcription factor ASR3-like [Oryza brachyantha]